MFRQDGAQSSLVKFLSTGIFNKSGYVFLKFHILTRDSSDLLIFCFVVLNRLIGSYRGSQ